MSSSKALISALFIAGSVTASAQTSTNSPYTRYGLGDLSDQAFSYNAAMGGTGYALRTNSHINIMNPASYTAVDSLSFMFDIGMSLKNSNYQENGIKTNAKNSSFDYLAMQFRLHPRLGMAIGFTPFSTMGYNFNRTNEINNPTTGETSEVSITNSFYGEGGLQQIFGGLGFKISNSLSVGVNAGYLYGKLNYQTTAELDNGGDQTITYNNIKINSYKIDFGIQYTQQLNKTDRLTLGLTYGLGHSLTSTEDKGIKVADPKGSYIVNNETTIYDSYGIPHTFGAGLSYMHKRKLTVAFDYTLQKWTGVKYDNRTDLYNNRSKIAAGAEYLPNVIGRNYLARIGYRIGAYYSTPYLKVPYSGNYINGPKEYGVSIGLGLPLSHYQRNSVLSITGQYIHVNPSVKDMLSENRFVIKLGLTFNERWFMKWRVN